jgi:hypothetical protein
LYVPAVVPVVVLFTDVPVPEIPGEPLHSRPVAPVGKRAEKVMPVPAHCGLFEVSDGTPGTVTMVAVVEVV